MPKIFFFGEDLGHESYVTPLIRRLAIEADVPVTVKPFSASGGITKVHYELERFLTDLAANKVELPDGIIVATDSNCMGYKARKENIEKPVKKFPQYQDLVTYAIPEPHIERWMLLDQAAFKSVVGKACKNPPLKCEKDLYKNLLLQSIKDAGKTPLIGGFEFAEDIVNELDVAKVEATDDSFHKLTRDLRAALNRLKH